jgi:hypothetical protein
MKMARTNIEWATHSGSGGRSLIFESAIWGD